MAEKQAAARGLTGVQPAERVACIYFLLLAAFSWQWPIPLANRTVLLLLPAVLCALHRWDRQTSGLRAAAARPWTTVLLILPAYWSVEFFAVPIPGHWERSWILTDRALLDSWGLRAAIESAGPLLPWILETAYLLLYAIPVACLGVLAWSGKGARSGRFLLVLFIGTFTVYALLPHFPVAPPREAFPGVDLPSFRSWSRVINNWVLDHMDISTSAFPSGHVAVAFSSAFGMKSALPERRGIWSGVFVAAVLVYVATIYGRYHYAVDGLVSICIAWLGWQAAERYYKTARD